MRRPKIAFDVDGTLIRLSDYGSVPRYDIIDLVRFFNSHTEAELYVWSGSGLDYAKTWTEKLGLTCMTAIPKEKNLNVDICFDDEDVELAKVNIQV